MSSPLIVIDRNGERGIATGARFPAESESQIQVRWDGGAETTVPVAALIAQPDGTYLLPSGSNQPDEPGPAVIPVVEEQLEVGKRFVETGGGVRVHKVVHQHEELVDQELLKHEVDVRRVPVDRVVDGPIDIRHEGATMIVPVLEERLVLQKQLVLVEEIHITARELSTRQSQRVTLRKEEAIVERLGGKGPAGSSPAPTTGSNEPASTTSTAEWSSHPNQAQPERR